MTSLAGGSNVTRPIGTKPSSSSSLTPLMTRSFQAEAVPGRLNPSISAQSAPDLRGIGVRRDQAKHAPPLGVGPPALERLLILSPFWSRRIPAAVRYDAV